MTIRELTEELERKNLAPGALPASLSRGREREEPPCDVRTCFQRDVDRITYSKAFRRLKQKTQVFLSPEGDHYRTRLTHTFEVTRIARTMARALRLNEDLAEAIALGHDLGHTPFGHAGEAALDRVTAGGFTHNGQGVRVVRFLERDGAGLNLSHEVIDGILCHTGPQEAQTMEGRLIKFADRIAYINHDIEDAVRAGILKESDIPQKLLAALGGTSSARIDTMVRDVLENSTADAVKMSDRIGGAMLELREFMFEHVYKNPVAKGEEVKAKAMLCQLYAHYDAHPDKLPEEYHRIARGEGAGRAAADYIAGMTDQYAVTRYTELFIPEGWARR